MATKIWGNDKISELTEEFMEIAKDENSTCFIKFIDEKALAFSNVALRHDYVAGKRHLLWAILKVFVWKKIIEKKVMRESL